MLSRGRRRSARARLRASAIWPILLALPLIAAGCVSIVDRSGSTAVPRPTPTPLESAATATPFTLVTPSPRPTPKATPAPVNAEVVGFLPGTLLEQATKALDPSLLSIVALHGVEAAGNGKLVAKKQPSGSVPSGWKALHSDAFKELQTRLQDEGVKVVLTIQRFGWTDGTLKRTQTLLTSKANRDRLAGQIASLVKEQGLDGVNLDVEPVPDNLATGYLRLVRAVRSALDEVDPELHLSVDVLPSLSGYDLAALTADNAADLAIVMGYNLRGENAAKSGSIAPLQDGSVIDLTTAVDNALAEVAPDKLILALPWYGRSWATQSDKAGAATLSGRGIDAAANVPYAEAIVSAATGGRRYDTEQASAWTAYPSRSCASCQAVWRQVWYDDPDSFGAKLDLAINDKLAGIGIWALGQEDGRDEMWWALRDRLRPIEDTQAPNGSASLDPDSILGQHQGLDVIDGSAKLRLFASDGEDGSGLTLARIGLDGEVGEDGSLVKARTYPAVDRIDFPLADPETGGSATSGSRTVYVQWRDIAGNWSTPISLDLWVEGPTRMQTPADLG